MLVEADPLESIANLRRIHAVVLGGRLLERAELDTLPGSGGRPGPPADEAAPDDRSPG